MNPFDPDRFVKGAPCTPCCAGGETDCSCALLIPPFDTPFSDYSAAEGVVSDPLLVTDCLIFTPSVGTMTTASASFDGTTLTASATWSAPSSWATWVSISAKSAATVTMAATDGDVIDAIIYDCNGNVVETLGPSASPVTSSALPADGVYYLFIHPNDPPPFGTGFTACTITVTSSDTFWVNPVIALWDDSGTTRSLWACPKLLLPPLTESTGDWYADCAAADAAISAQASNCVGFMETTPFTAFVATDGGTSLTLVLTGTGDSGSGPENDLTAWGGFNAEAGETISITFSSVGGFSTTYYAEIYDDLGVSVESFSAMSGSPFVSSALPYTGRYSIRVRFNTLLAPSPATIVATFTITSSGTMSVNEISARYDLGLTCSGNLDCGDSCP